MITVARWFERHDHDLGGSGWGGNCVGPPPLDATRGRSASCGALAVRWRRGAGGEHVVAAELEHEVEQVVVGQCRAGLGLERLRRNLPDLSLDAAGHQ